MKLRILICILLLVLFDCKEKQGKSEFDAFLETIPPTKTPAEFTYFTNGVPSDPYNNGFKKFRTVWTKWTMTKLHSKVGEFVVLVHADTGIVNVPFLVSYNDLGQKTDSLMAISVPSYEDTFSIEQKLIVASDRFTVRSVIRNWKIDSLTGGEKDHTVANVDSVYVLSDDGKFTLNLE